MATDRYAVALNPGPSEPSKGDKGIEGAKGEERQSIDSLASYVYNQWLIFRNHGETIAWRERCLKNLRAYKGEYDATQMAVIKQFGGSDAYSHITGVKCRGATALLRDIFLGQEQIWGLRATDVPEMPTNIMQSIQQLVEGELQSLAMSGAQISPEQFEDRVRQLVDAAKRAMEDNALKEATKAEKQLQDMLVEGEFYQALVDFITDLPIFPFACIKGPVVMNVMDNKWIDGQLVRKRIPRMFWYRVSPLDLWFTPGASRIDQASTIEHIKISRSDLNALIGLPGFDELAIRRILKEYEDGYIEPWMDDHERAHREDRESPYLNESNLLDSFEWNGPVPGRLMREYGFSKDQIPDPELDYHVQAWVIGRHTIKTQINPDVKERPPYYISSYEKVPGNLRGLGVPDILDDIQKTANACLRSLINNMSIASGPQVAINERNLSPATNANTLYPWKRWRFLYDPVGSNPLPPIQFFQPESRAQELLMVYQAMTTVADETSSIPRYVTGNERIGGAGRTASGLSMLMSSASKMIQVVAANIDRDVLKPIIERLYDMVMLTDPSGLLRGDEDIQVRGVEIARQREQERSRRLEFLQIITNPLDAQIIGPEGRAHILRALADDLGLTGNDIVPSELDLEKINQAMAQMGPGGGAQGGGQAPSPNPPGNLPGGMPGQTASPGSGPGVAPPGPQQFNAERRSNI